MSLLTKKEFSAKCNKSTKELSVYISRKKVVVTDDLIDPAHPTNKAFLLKHGGTPDAKPVKTERVAKPDPEDTEEQEYDTGGFKTLEQSELEYQHYRAERNAKAVELADIEIAKKRGQLIPPELVKELFKQHNQSVLVEFKNMMDAELRSVAKEYDISVDKVAEIKGRWIEGLNGAVDRAKASTAKGIESIVNNVQESK